MIIILFQFLVTTSKPNNNKVRFIDDLIVSLNDLYLQRAIDEQTRIQKGNVKTWSFNFGISTNTYGKHAHILWGEKTAH